MKRWTGLLLAMLLSLSLALPTMAVEEVGEAAGEAAVIAQGGAASVENYNQGFEAGYDKGWEEGMAEGTADYPGTYKMNKQYAKSPAWDTGDGTQEQGYADGLALGYESGYQSGYDGAQWDAGYNAGHKLGYGDAAAGRTRQTLTYQEDDTYSYSKALGYDNGYEEYIQVKQQQENRNESIKKAGGTVGKINVKLNDKCIAFPDAMPENTKGSIIAPVAPILKSLGASVEKVENTLKIVHNGTTINMVIGDNVATVEKDGSSRQVKMGAPCYLKYDRVYVPLRFLSETFGYDIYWDQDYKTVVLLDKKAVTDTLNTRFATANIFMQSQAKLLSDNWISQGSFKMNLEIIDSIDGNKTYTATGTMKAHSGGGAMNMDAVMDFTNFASMIDGFKAMQDQSVTASLEMLKPFMKKNTFSMKILPEGDYYIKSELYDFMAQNMMGLEIDSSKETWYRLTQVDPTLLTAEGYTVGNYLYSVAEASLSYGSPFMFYDNLMDLAQQAERFVGNDRFKTQGSNYVWTMDKEELLRLVGGEEETQKMLNAMFQELKLNVTFNKNGVYSMQGNIKLSMSGLGSLMNLEMDQSGSHSGSSSSALFQVRNLFNLSIKGSTTITKTTAKPDTSLPQDAQIIDFMEMMK